MNWVDRLRTSADKRMWSGRRAVVMRTGRRAELLGVKLGCLRSCIYVHVCIYLYIYRVYVYVYAYLCIDCGSWYQCFSVWTVSCMRMCFRVHMHAHTYVCRYIYMYIFFVQ